MFFLRKSLESIRFFDGLTDWHSHILPGVDDGVPSMDMSLEILERFESLGVKELWLTPHIMEDFPNKTENLKKRFEELLVEYHGGIHLHLGAEYMMDTLFEERLKNNDLLPLGEHSRHLLVETSYFNPPMDLYGTLDSIKKKGFVPLLAHPERYLYMDKNDYEKLKSKGIMFQCNLTSIAGAYGKDAYRKFEWFLKKNWVNAFGTDTHRLMSFNHAVSFKSITSKQSKLMFNCPNQLTF